MDITGYSHNGAGVGRLNGQVVFVRGALEGEKVAVELAKQRKGIWEGTLKGVIVPHANRAAPACPVYTSCGGCHFQHVAYPEQLRIKERIVRNTIRRIGSLRDVPVHPTLGMDYPWGYRNKGVFQAGRRGDRVVLGFYEEGSHSLAPQFCRHLFSPAVASLVACLEELLTARGIMVAENNAPGLKHVLVRESRVAGDILLVFVGSGTGDYDGIDYEIAREICCNNSKVVGVCQNKNPRGPVTGLLGDNTRVVYGRGEIEDRIGPFSFTISPPSFFQVNTQQARVLYERTVAYAGLTGEELVVDAYCGIGSISLFLAQKAGRVLGIESVPQAVGDARRAAVKNGVGNVEFIQGEAEKVLPGLVGQGMKPDVVIVDPPRGGCGKELLEAIIQAGPRRVVYVSCNPSTLARDLKILAAGGFGVAEVQPVDMFPQTYHVECVTLMSRVEK